ncbi:MAG: phosphopantetheinyl transferase [Flavobacteriales bacterium]|jgi:phosphopantetheinyl transferase
MSFIGEIPTGSATRLFLWQVEENPDHPKYAKIASTFRGKSLKRRTEELGGTLLLEHLGIKNDISYLENGKPVVDDGYISISHTEDLVGVVFSTSPVGLDIQRPTPKLFNIKEKFCNERELKMWGESLDQLTLIWSAKEAVFKLFGENLAFAEEIDVHFGDKDNEFYAKVRGGEESFTLHHLMFKEKKVVWVST